MGQIVVVYKKSKLDLYVTERKNARYRALLDDNDPAVGQLEAAHQAHQRSMEALKAHLRDLGIPHRFVYRARFRKPSNDTLVIAIGGDGTVLDASHKIEGATLLGLNSDPARSGGYLCAANLSTLPELLDNYLSDRIQPQKIARLGGTVDDVPLPFPILNDALLTHKNPAATARYAIGIDGIDEVQKSSGIWICGPAGSTAAMASAGGKVQPLEDGRMQYRVREPYDTDGHGMRHLHGMIQDGHQLWVRSHMREGVIFLDGSHVKVAFPVGAVLRMSASAPALRLLCTDEMDARRRAAMGRLGAASPDAD